MSVKVIFNIYTRSIGGYALYGTAPAGVALSLGDFTSGRDEGSLIWKRASDEWYAMVYSGMCTSDITNREERCVRAFFLNEEAASVLLESKTVFLTMWRDLAGINKSIIPVISQTEAEWTQRLTHPEPDAGNDETDQLTKNDKLMLTSMLWCRKQNGIVYLPAKSQEKFLKCFFAIPRELRMELDFSWLYQDAVMESSLNFYNSAVESNLRSMEGKNPNKVRMYNPSLSEFNPAVRREADNLIIAFSPEREADSLIKAFDPEPEEKPLTAVVFTKPPKASNGTEASKGSLLQKPSNFKRIPHNTEVLDLSDADEMAERIDILQDPTEDEAVRDKKTVTRGTLKKLWRKMRTIKHIFKTGLTLIPSILLLVITISLSLESTAEVVSGRLVVTVNFLGTPAYAAAIVTAFALGWTLRTLIGQISMLRRRIIAGRRKASEE